jgi:hypothetical protein
LTTVVRRFPTFEIDLITQSTSYVLRYDTSTQASQFTSGELEEALIQFYITNDMTNDSPVFTMVVLAKTKWDEVLNANDLIRVRVYPDRTQTPPDNPYIMVGLLSDIHKEGEYVNGTLLYRLTGNAMTKALMDFQVGVIQEVSTVLPSIGWLPDNATGGSPNGLDFTGNTAAGIGDQLMSRFVYQYAQYQFADGKTLHDYLTHSFSSWENDEYLSDTSNFVNYQGSIRQFLQDVSAAPFNELFFEYTNTGVCVALMRPAPFDPDMWQQVPAYRFTSDIVVEESYGKSDAEMYSIFIVSAPNLLEMTSVDIGVFPKYNPEIIKKYGYKEYRAENVYLLTPGSATTDTTDSKDNKSTSTPTSNGDITSPAFQPPTYDKVNSYLSQMGYLDQNFVRTNKSMVYSDILSAFQGLNDTAASDIVDTVIAGSFSKDMFATILKSDSVAQYDKSINKEKTISPDKLNEFTQRLFNWYCENANFYSGDIRVLGNPAYRLGTRVFYEDLEENTTWEFYVESVEHDFDFTQGYTTILGVTRGLPNYGAKRFSNLWGTSLDFKGGYMGEQPIDQLIQPPTTTNNSYSGNYGSNYGGDGSMGAVSTAQATTSRKTIYKLGAGRTGTDPLQTAVPTMDCSSFVWWCFYDNGIYLKGGPTGMTTRTISSDPKLQTIGNRGDDKNAVLSRMQVGDIVWFDTDGADAHVGIYVGGGNCVACNTSNGVQEFSISNSYWWKAFVGHVARYNG